VPALASDSRVAAGDDDWLLMAVRGHLGDTLHLLGAVRRDHPGARPLPVNLHGRPLGDTTHAVELRVLGLWPVGGNNGWTN
jgi:hypothetical protein